MSRWLAIVAFSLLVGCAPYKLIEPARQNVGSGFSVETAMRWNQLAPEQVSGPVVVWTADGVGLDQLMFFTVAEGEPLLRRIAQPSVLQQGPPPAPSQTAEAEKLPAFRADMTPNEIAELFEAAIARVTRSTIADAGNLRPMEFAGRPGFRFDFDYVTRDDLERRGLAVGTVKDKKLYLIFFQGPRLYHYEKYLAEVENIVRSARLL